MSERIMHYGKGDVFVYRTFGKPLGGVRPIPESQFTGNSNVIFGFDMDVQIKGEAFYPSFAEGDNSLVVATDSMKNFILAHAGRYTGETGEGLLREIAARFLETYPQMESVLLSAERIPFAEIPVPAVPGNGGPAFRDSGLVFSRLRDERAHAAVEIVRQGGSPVLQSHESGLRDLQLIKVRGSAFAGFVRDEYTTLPETFDRPLFIYLNIYWKYADYGDALDPSRGGYVPAEQIRDLAACVFHEENSPSIQHLIYRIGLRILERFPSLAQVRFESNNRTWETIVENIPGSEGRVYTEPRPPYGFQGFSMTQDDLAREGEARDERKADDPHPGYIAG